MGCGSCGHTYVRRSRNYQALVGGKSSAGVIKSTPTPEQTEVESASKEETKTSSISSEGTTTPASNVQDK